MPKATGSVPGTPQRVNINAGSKVAPATSVTAQSAAAPRRGTVKANATIGLHSFSKSDIVPVIVPRTDARSELAAESKKEVDLASRTMPFSLQSKSIELRKLSNGRDELDQPTVSGQSETAGPNPSSLGNIANRNIFSVVRAPAQGLSTAERNMMDDSSGFPSKHDTCSAMDAPANYQRENCKCLVVRRRMLSDINCNQGL